MKVFCKTSNLFLFEYRAENFRLAVRKKSAGLLCCLPTSPWGHFEENLFEKFLHLLWTFFQINSGNWAGKVWPACQNCIHRIYKIILKKKLFWKTNEILHHFQTLSRKFSASCRVFRRGCWNCNLRVQGNILTKNSFISIFFSILDTERFFWPILAKN